jgi:transcriptional regulator with XRE-family HTH domain
MSPSHGSEDADPRRLRELADFLRDRRSRLDPDELGLPARRRRRTAGLRREDIAERAAVSVAWYTNLEQARPVKPSKAVIAALADALCLDDDDRAYLHRLAGHASPTTSRRSDIDRAVLQTLVDGVPYPAYCTDALTNVIAWNAAAALVFGDYAAWPAEQRNLLLLLFTETGFRTRFR